MNVSVLGASRGTRSLSWSKCGPTTLGPPSGLGKSTGGRPFLLLREPLMRSCRGPFRSTRHIDLSCATESLLAVRVDAVSRPKRAGRNEPINRVHDRSDGAAAWLGWRRPGCSTRKPAILVVGPSTMSARNDRAGRQTYRGVEVAG